MHTARGYTAAYLVELRTIAGLSGSPVFQTSHPVRIRNGDPQFRNQDVSQGTILGMLIGYHCVEDKDDIIPIPRFEAVREASAGGAEYSADERNTGFGVVIPIERVFEVFERADVRQSFENAIAMKGTLSSFRGAATKG